MSIIKNMYLNKCLGVTPASAAGFFGNSLGKKIQTPSRDDGEYR
jgi:hypothetical protein